MKEEENKQEEEVQEEKKLDLRKVYIKNYGNLILNIIGTNDIGLSAQSQKRNEELFIPWTSIIMVTKEDFDEPTK